MSLKKKITSTEFTALSDEDKRKYKLDGDSYVLLSGEELAALAEKVKAEAAETERVKAAGDKAVLAAGNLSPAEEEEARKKGLQTEEDRIKQEAEAKTVKVSLTAREEVRKSTAWAKVHAEALATSRTPEQVADALRELGRDPDKGEY